jgi:hypothetical protein
MPKIAVRVPHAFDPPEALARLLPALEKSARDFQGRDLEVNQEGNAAQFTFKSMAFTISGRAESLPGEAVVEVDLPFAAMMFKDQAEKAIAKNMTRALSQQPAAD